MSTKNTIAADCHENAHVEGYGPVYAGSSYTALPNNQSVRELLDAGVLTPPNKAAGSPGKED